MKKVIITADDYGALDFIDNGIKRALSERKVSSVACFVTFPNSANRIKKLMEMRSDPALQGHDFGIGLHFSVSAGAPLIYKKTMMSKVDKNGVITFKGPNYYPYDSFKKNDIEDFKNELREQIEMLQGIIGKDEKIDSVSNHHGFAYVDPYLYKAYLGVIAEYGIPIRSPLTWSRSGLHHQSYDGKPLSPVVRSGFAMGSWRSLFLLGKKKLEQKKDDAISAGVPTTFCLADIIYGQPDILNLMGIFHEYQSCDMSTELMFHLGYDASGTVPGKQGIPEGIDQGYFEMRTVELDSLMHLDIDGNLKDFGIDYVNFRKLTLNDAARPACL